MDNPVKKAIVIDTCFLRSYNHRNPELEKLWRKARNKSLEIFIPHVALEEWRTQKVTDLIDVIRQAKKTIHDGWRSNLIAEDIANPNDFDLYPADDVIIAKSKKRIDRFLKENNIQKIELSAEQAQRTWDRYFECRAPFNANKAREDRRKDIPDAFILEAAIDFRSSHEVHCLLSETPDGRLLAALEAEGLRVHRGLKDLLNYFDSLAIAPAGGGAPAIVDGIASPSKVADVDAALRTLDEAERMLQTRVLGYVSWFAPIAKSQLSDLLESKGHAQQAINNVAQRFVINGLILDTGNHFLPGDPAVCEAAAKSVISEITEIIGGS